MQMNTTRVHNIEHHRTALLAIVAALVAMLGGRLRVARRVRVQILRVLRPAEAAVRRLIFVAAKDVEAAHYCPPRASTFGTPPVRPLQRRSLAFVLADTMPPLIKPTGVFKRPRIRSVEPIDPTVVAVFEAHRAVAASHARVLMQQSRTDLIHDGLVDVSRLSHRLAAITKALTDLPRQAKRLARWKARRAWVSQKRLTYTVPLRPGPPPGHRGPPRHQAEEILHNCHLLAHDVRYNSS
jgi:hypothetical protein